MKKTAAGVRLLQGGGPREELRDQGLHRLHSTRQGLVQAEAWHPTHSPPAGRAACPAAPRGCGSAPAPAPGGRPLPSSPGLRGAVHHPSLPSARPPDCVPHSGHKQSCWASLGPSVPWEGPGAAPFSLTWKCPWPFIEKGRPQWWRLGMVWVWWRLAWSWRPGDSGVRSSRPRAASS